MASQHLELEAAARQAQKAAADLNSKQASAQAELDSMRPQLQQACTSAGEYKQQAQDLQQGLSLAQQEACQVSPLGCMFLPYCVWKYAEYCIPHTVSSWTDLHSVQQYT